MPPRDFSFKRTAKRKRRTHGSESDSDDSLQSEIEDYCGEEEVKSEEDESYRM